MDQILLIYTLHIHCWSKHKHLTYELHMTGCLIKFYVKRKGISFGTNFYLLSKHIEEGGRSEI